MTIPTLCKFKRMALFLEYDTGEISNSTQQANFALQYVWNLKLDQSISLVTLKRSPNQELSNMIWKTSDFSIRFQS